MPFERVPSALLSAAGFVIVGAALYFGRDLFVPLALSGLLAFLLSPVVTRVERMGASPVVAVVLVTVLLAAASVVALWMVTLQLSQLLVDLPDLRGNLSEKLRTLLLPLRSLSDALGWVEKISQEVVPQGSRAPARVEVIDRTSAVELIGLLPPLLGPLGIAAVVAVLTLFMLTGRRDLRDRLVRLLGARDVPISIVALDEAGPRVSAYLGRQALVCGVHGAAVTLGLSLLGLPGAMLFGVISAVLRVIPYVGPWIAAGLPIALAAAAYPGWSLAGYTVAFFIVLELISNNVLEPWLYGAGAGLSPFGVILSAFFWTWVWGAAGLVLAIPLTVCLVVLGRYLPQLSFLTTLVGDEPIPPLQARFYERLVAGDADEAGAILRQSSADGDALALSDLLVLPTLLRLAQDRESDARSPARVAMILDLLSELLDEALPASPQESAASAEPVTLVAMRDVATERFLVDWLARLLEHVGLASAVHVRDARHQDLAETKGTLVLSALTANSARRALQRLQSMPSMQARVVLGAWGMPRLRGVRPPAEIARVHTSVDLAAALAPESESESETEAHGTKAADPA
jgi:predicted PurR-regulated permease PerM